MHNWPRGLYLLRYQSVCLFSYSVTLLPPHYHSTPVAFMFFHPPGSALFSLFLLSLPSLSLSYQFILIPLNTLMVSCNVSYGIKRQKINHNIRPLPYINATANLMPSYIRFIVSQHFFASFDKAVWMLLWKMHE